MCRKIGINFLYPKSLLYLLINSYGQYMNKDFLFNIQSGVSR